MPSGLRPSTLDLPAMTPSPKLSAAVRDFLDFLRAQKGAYTDACAGFRRNEITVKRQVHRWMKPNAQSVGDDGQARVIFTSVEDPREPDVIVHSIRLTKEFIAANERSGSNEQQVCRALIVFIYAYWEDVTRHECAKALEVEKTDLRLPIAGDLRLLRHAMLHTRNVLRADAHRKLEVLQELFRPDKEVIFTHAKMHEIFRLLDKHVAQFAIQRLGFPDPPGGIEGIKEIAITRGLA
jgi:hypothetical protein